MKTGSRKIHSPQTVGRTGDPRLGPRAGAPFPWLPAGVALFLGAIPLLAWGPFLFDTPAGVVSAAAAEGYSSRAAYGLAVGWLALGLAGATWWGARGSGAARAAGAAPEPAPLEGRRRGVVLGAVAVFAFTVLVYFPPFLAQRGPFVEDNIHLTALHRMLGGQRPYVDFEFLYGPLMLMPAYLWTKLFGYSLPAFYTYVALLEATLFAVLYLLVSRLIPAPRWRVLALAVLAGLLFNVLVGPNWSASRRMFGLLGLVVIASDPLRPRSVAIAAPLLGLQLAWSHDFGVMALIGAAALYGVLLLDRARRRSVLVAGPAVAVGAALVWFVTTRLLLGDGFSAYLSEASYLTSRFSAGEAGFRFYWTANSLAVFALLVFSCVVVGRGLLGRRDVEPTRADLLLVAGLAFAFVGLKSGLNRADLWHVNAPMLPLVLALLIPEGRRRFHYGTGARTLAMALLIVMSATFFFGLLPTGSLLANGWWTGAKLTLAGPPPAERAEPPATRAPIIGHSRHEPESTAYRLASLLATPEFAHRPVLFYSDTWSLGKHIGVYKMDFINDDFLYSDERGLKVRDFLERSRGAIILMTENAYERLYGERSADDFPEHLRRFEPSAAKRMASWLSTTHYRGLEVEVRLKDERWRRTVGNYVAQRFEKAAQIGRIIVLVS